MATNYNRIKRMHILALAVLLAAVTAEPVATAPFAPLAHSAQLDEELYAPAVASVDDQRSPGGGLRVDRLGHGAVAAVVVAVVVVAAITTGRSASRHSSMPSARRAAWRPCAVRVRTASWASTQ